MNDNFILESNNGHDQSLEFGKYEILEYKTKKSIEKYKAYYYLVDTTKGYKDKRISAIYTKEHDLKEFYFDNGKGNYFKGTIIKVDDTEEIFRLVIDELPRNKYKTIKVELKELVKEAIDGQ